MFFDSASQPAPPAGLSANVIVLPVRPEPAPPAEASRDCVYQVRVAGRIFRGGDTRTLLKLAVQARASRRLPSMGHRGPE